MKRSEYVAVGAVGLIAAAALWSEYGPREAEPETIPANMLVYETPEACQQDGKVDAKACASEFEKARDRFTELAPKYSQQSNCEAEFGAGRCRSTLWQGAEAFVPVMAGYMIARQFTGGSNTVTQPLLPGQPRPPCPPGAAAGADPACAPTAAQANSGSSSGSRSSSSSSSSGSSSFRTFSSYRTPSGAGVTADGGSRAMAAATAPRPSSGVSSVSRGGFGGTARSLSFSSGT